MPVRKIRAFHLAPAFTCCIAFAARAADLTFPDQHLLLDEGGATPAWVGSCTDPLAAGVTDQPGERPLLKFGANRDGDIVGWRFDAATKTELDAQRIPMLWIRDDPSSRVWTPVRLPVTSDTLAAAATGVVRVRACASAAPTGIFVSGWRQVGFLGEGGVARYVPALWYLASGAAGHSAPVMVPVAPHFCDDAPGFPDELLVEASGGSAWATGAIEVLYPDGCSGQGQSPRIVVYATQGYLCNCPGAYASPTAFAPMRIEFDVEDWLIAHAAGTDGCTCEGACYEPLRWRLTDGYPAIETESRWLVANREVRSVAHVDGKSLAVTRTGSLDSRHRGCEGWMTQCGSLPAMNTVGPIFGSLVFDDFGSAAPLPTDRYLVGAVGDELTFPGDLPTPETRIFEPKGMSLMYEPERMDMPFVSRQYGSAARIGPAGFEQIVAGWRSWTDDPSSVFVRKHPIAWFPMELRTPVADCLDGGGGSKEGCLAIIGAATSEQIHGQAVELPLLTSDAGVPESAAWAVDCAFVGKNASCSGTWFAGGGLAGARIWYEDSSGWRAQRLPSSSPLTEAQAVLADGAVVVLGTSDCVPFIGPFQFQPARVVLPPKAADINADGEVNAADLAILLASWNAPSGSCSPADIDGDGEVNAVDLSAILAGWG